MRTAPPGCSAASSTSTERPASASRIAAASPFGPLPTTTASLMTGAAHGDAPAVALERVTDEPEHRRPEPHEQRPPLGVAARVLIDRLGPDPEIDAEPDRPEAGDVEMPAGEARAAECLDDHAPRLPILGSGRADVRPRRPPLPASSPPRAGRSGRLDLLELSLARHAAAPPRAAGHLGGGRPASAAARRADRRHPDAPKTAPARSCTATTAPASAAPGSTPRRSSPSSGPTPTASPPAGSRSSSSTAGPTRGSPSATNGSCACQGRGTGRCASST